MQTPRTLPVHQSLHRHQHVMGAERELLLTSALVAILVGVGGLSLLSGVTAVVFWLVAVALLRRMAKADPIMSRVYLRHVRQQEYYPARAGIWRR